MIDDATCNLQETTAFKTRDKQTQRQDQSQQQSSQSANHGPEIPPPVRGVVDQYYRNDRWDFRSEKQASCSPSIAWLFMITKEREKKKENKGKRADDTLLIVLCRENGFGVSASCASCLPLERLQSRIQNNGARVPLFKIIWNPTISFFLVVRFM
jgi:hypothetical protein